MRIETFFDPRTYTLTYLVWDPDSLDAVIIDPVLDYDSLAVATYTESIDQISRAVDESGLKLHYVLETHAHADHLSGSQLLRERYGARVAIGARIIEVQQVFKDLFNLEQLATDGSQFDRLVEDDETIEAGTLAIRAIATPGHTPACLSYMIRDAVFTGDALFMPDYGTGRCDFPRGSAEQLYDSVQRLYQLPEETRVFVGHDYQPGGRLLAWQTTIGESRRTNIQLKADTPKKDFVAFRQERDATLRPPRLIFQSVQVNVDAGRLPEPESNGRRYLKLPLNLFPARD